MSEKSKSIDLNDASLTPISTASPTLKAIDNSEILTPTSDAFSELNSPDNKPNKSHKPPFGDYSDGLKPMNSESRRLNEDLKHIKARDLMFERLLLLSDLVHAFREISGATSSQNLADVFITTDDILAFLNTQGLGATNQVVPLVKGTLNRIAAGTNGKVYFKSLFIRGNVGRNVIINALLGNMVIRDFKLFSKHIKNS